MGPNPAGIIIPILLKKPPKIPLFLPWYEQKAVSILLTLLALGIKNIYLGPSLPAFISPNVLNVLIEKFNIHPISTPKADLKAILKKLDT
jgi:hydroxylamine reductase